MHSLFSGQDPRLAEAARRFAEAVQREPLDARYGGTRPRALLVGGFVRDALLGARSFDADVEVFGVSPERVQAIAEALWPGRVLAVGEAFGILKLALGDGLDFDIALPRRESKAGKGHKGFLVESDPSMGAEEAARRRDFTVNAISADPLTDEIIDPVHGQDDLRARRLRVVDPATFSDDPLRVYRAVQLAPRLNFAIEPESFALLRAMVEHGELAELSKERVTDEFKKLLLKAARPSQGFELLRELGVIERDYPELHAMIGTPQEPEWHPEGDVWIHTMMVMDWASRIAERGTFSGSEKLQFLIGALCHDLGKPATTVMGEKEGVPRIRSLGHEEAGEEPTRALLTRWTFGEDVERAAVVSAREHLKPSMLFLQLEKGALTPESYANAVRKLIKRIHPVSWRVLLAIAEADHRGRTIPGVDTEPYAAGELFVKTVSEKKLDAEPTKPLVLGRDLLERGLEPGPKIGQIINEIENARDRGELTTRDEALEYLERILKRP